MISEKEWVDRLYEVRKEPDKLIVMITNRRKQLKILSETVEYKLTSTPPDIQNTVSEELEVWF